MNFIKRLFCAHDWQFVRNIYGDEIYEFGGVDPCGGAVSAGKSSPGTSLFNPRKAKVEP